MLRATWVRISPLAQIYNFIVGPGFRAVSQFPFIGNFYSEKIPIYALRALSSFPSPLNIV